MKQPAAPAPRQNQDNPAADRVTSPLNGAALSEAAGAANHKIHRFQPVVAEAYGIPAALVYQTVLWRSGRARQGWVGLSVSELAEEYSYLGASTVCRALNALRCGTDEAASLIRRRTSFRGSYEYTADLTSNPNEGAHSLDPDILKALLRVRKTTLGEALAAAIIYSNLNYWILCQWKTLAETASKNLTSDFEGGPDEINSFVYTSTMDKAWWRTSIKEWWRRRTYMSRRTCERGFKLLEEQKYLRKRCRKDGKHDWSLSCKQLKKEASKWCNARMLNEISDQMAGSASSWHTQRPDGRVSDQMG